jgi:hypothetical protein
VEPRFPRAQLDNELTDFIASELGPLGLVPDQKAFERIFVNVVFGDGPKANLGVARVLSQHSASAAKAGS